MRRSLTLQTLAVAILTVVLVSPPAFAEQPISWGAIKATHAVAAADKFQDLDPWPLPYEKHSNISDLDAHRAMLLAGIQNLTACSDVFVIGQTNDFGDGGAVLIKGIRADSNYGLWYVDLSTNSLLGEYTVLSFDPESMEVLDVSTQEVISTQTMDDAAASESCHDQVVECAIHLGIDPNNKSIRDLWDEVKNAWNGLNTCERVFLVGGIVTCSLAGSAGAGMICGAAFWVAGTTTC